MPQILLSIAAFISAYSGGLFVMKFKNHIHRIMGFAAGILLGVIAFEILPEIIHLTHEYDIEPRGIMLALVAGFLLFHILEKTVLIHHSHESEYAEHRHPHVGSLSALALAGHSLMDGMAIGLAFQINEVVGFMVAAAVIMHAFTDGMNTVTLMLINNNSTKKSKLFLLIVALAPIIGAASTLFFTVSPNILTHYLGFFAGFLLYIGAADILPEAHSKNSSITTIGLTIAGVLLIFIATMFLSHQH